MFTGIVETVGTVRAVVNGAGLTRLTVSVGPLAEESRVGDSIAINGVCLTVVEVAGAEVAFEVVSETLVRTNLGDVEVESPVNLERPVVASGRFDGHMVQGHVDGTATVRSFVPDGDGRRLWIDLESDLLRYVVAKGSICVDGVSLTVSGVDEGGCEVALIPHTLTATTLGASTPGRRVNVEVDILAKYVERLMENRQ